MVLISQKMYDWKKQSLKKWQQEKDKIKLELHTRENENLKASKGGIETHSMVLLEIQS